MAAKCIKMGLAVVFICSVFSVSSVQSQSEVDLQTVTVQEWNEVSSSNQKLLVVFYKQKGCAGCEEMTDVVKTLVGNPDLDEDLRIGKSTDTALAASLGIVAYPAVVFVRENTPLLYDGKPNADDIVEWLELSRSKITQHLYDDSFEHLTQASTGATTDDWLVAFYQESCQSILTAMESVGVRIRQKTNVAVVDASKNKLLVDRFAIQKCPEIILFKQGKMYRFDVPKTDQASLKSFVDAWHKNSKAETVLPPKSQFDYLTESIARYIKTQIQGENRKYMLLALCGGVLSLVLMVMCCCQSVVASNRKLKHD